MTDILRQIAGRQVGLDANNNLLVRDPETNVNHYVPRGADISRIVVITQAAYDLLSPPVATTLYVIVG